MLNRGFPSAAVQPGRMEGLQCDARYGDGPTCYRLQCGEGLQAKGFLRLLYNFADWEVTHTVLNWSSSVLRCSDQDSYPLHIVRFIIWWRCWTDSFARVWVHLSTVVQITLNLKVDSSPTEDIHMCTWISKMSRPHSEYPEIAWIGLRRLIEGALSLYLAVPALVIFAFALQRCHLISVKETGTKTIIFIRTSSLLRTTFTKLSERVDLFNMVEKA